MPSINGLTNPFENAIQTLNESQLSRQKRIDDYAEAVAAGYEPPREIMAAIEDILSQGVLNEATLSALASLIDQISSEIAPMIISNGGGDTATIEFAENSVAVVTVVSAIDCYAANNSDTNLEYSIVSSVGDDSGLFSIDATTGALSFRSPPDFEAISGPLTVTVRVSDGGVLVDDQVLSIVVTDVNEAPTIVSADTTGAVTEIIEAGPGENTVTLTDTGLIAFADVDLSDTHLVTVIPVSATDSLLGNVGARGTLTAVVSDPSTGDGAGAVTWTFAADDSALDDMEQGQTLTQVYTVTVDDQNGGVASETVTITINGADDGPVILNSAPTVTFAASGVNIAVTYGAGGSVGADLIVAQLNDDTFFDFNATAVHVDDADSLSELEGYSAVVHGARFDDLMTDAYWAALRAYVEADAGGVVTDGRSGSTIATLAGQAQADADFVNPITASAPGTEFYSFPFDYVEFYLSGGHPIDDGLSYMLKTGGWDYYTAKTVDPDAVSLGFAFSYSTSDFFVEFPVVYKDIEGQGNLVYLGGAYSENVADAELRTGAFDQLLEQAVNWAAGGAGGAAGPKPIEDTAFTIANIVIGDADAGTDPIEVTLDVANGALVLTDDTGLAFTDSDGSDGSLTFTGNLNNISASLAVGVVYTPDAEFNGIDTLTVTADDLGNNGVGGPMVTAASTEINVAAVNDNPTANDDGVFAAEEDVPLTILAADLLANDTDVDIATDGQALRVASVSGGIGGSATLIDNGTAIRFNPAEDFSGLATFDYTVRDDNGGIATASVSVDVAPVVDTPAIRVPGVGEFLPESQVDAPTINASQFNGSVAVLADGSIVHTWEGVNEPFVASNSSDILAQRFAADGTALGSLFRVNTTLPTEDEEPKITALADGGFVIVWGSRNGADGEINGQRFDAAGNAVGSEFQINTYTTSYQLHPNVAALSDGGFIVNWSSVGQANQTDIYAQRYDANGNPVGGEFRVNPDPAGNQTVSALSDNSAGLAGGGFVIAWQDSARGGSFAQQFDAAGNPVGTHFKVGVISGGQPNVAALADGGFVISWDSYNRDAFNSQGILAQRYDATGAPVGDEFQVNTTTAGDQKWSAVAGLENGGFVIAFEGEVGSDLNVYAQEYNSSGIAVGGEVLVNDNTAGRQHRISLDASPDGGYVVSFSNNVGRYSQEFFRVVDGNTATAVENTDIPIALSAVLVDADGSEALSDLTISGVPAGVTLSAGTDIGDGTWTLTQTDLDGLTLRAPDNWSGSFDLAVTVTATETATGDSATASETFTVTIDPVNDAPAIEIVTSAMPEAGQIAFSDPDSDDTHTATVLGVTVTGDESVLGGADAFDFLTLDPVDQATDTVDWTFSMLGLDPASVASGLTGGETLEFEYTVEIADLAADTDLATLTVTLNSDGLFV